MRERRVAGRTGLVAAPVAAAAVVFALAIAACGGSLRPDAHIRREARVTNTSTASGAGDYSDERTALVWMRQFSPESLLWQAVAIMPAGSGELTP
jgi:hypothetical protein